MIIVGLHDVTYYDERELLFSPKITLEVRNNQINRIGNPVMNGIDNPCVISIICYILIKEVRCYE